MGNQKNKRHYRNHHHHVYMKKNLTGRTIKDSDTDTQAHTPTVKIEGSRIINMQKLQQHINELTVHATKCGGSIILTGEERDGLASILSSHCSTCNHTITLETAQKVKGPRGYRRWECNLAAV